VRWEAMQHHSDWFNVYNRVVVDLAMHDVSGASEKTSSSRRA
jgi:4a-hydroxytetrahydrobiopterin dehydratase